MLDYLSENLTTKHDISSFAETNPFLDGQRWCLVIKSLDQLERRRRMIKALDDGPVMRVTHRPVANGLVVIGTFSKGTFVTERSALFREPRHIIRHPESGFLLTEVDAITHVDDELRPIDQIHNPLFSFLHTLDLSRDRERLLVCSTGFDAVMEISIKDGSQCGSWSAWENGFNPDADGTWLTLDPTTHIERSAKGLRSVLIDPDGSSNDGLGIIHRFRTAHPNFARYDRKSPTAFFVNIAFSGVLYKVDGQTGMPFPLCTLSPMSHGLNPHGSGWTITDTTVGKWYVLDDEFKIGESFDISGVPGKPNSVGSREWLQQVIPIETNQFLLIDSNRGLLGVDTGRRELCRYAINDRFCIQDAIRLD